ncbi:hypothetical protein Cni_G16483 [Canna indica]|uniref:Exocyst subunit Exo70 family protein n=1 Tax=Canna indica TaxID=4628 RepID=A0AAQ3KL23_9LILI|nr:hypothetical protein Cni_G16483 [Canna indica]
MVDVCAITETLIIVGYGNECIGVYKILCKLIKGLYRLGFVRLTSSQEVVIANIVENVVVQLLSFSELVKSKRSTEKMLWILDLYNIISELLPEIDALFSFGSTAAVQEHAIASTSKLTEASHTMFINFEVVVEKEHSKSMPLDAVIQAPTRHAIDYIAKIITKVSLQKESLHLDFLFDRLHPEALFERSTNCGSHKLDPRKAAPRQWHNSHLPTSRRGADQQSNLQKPAKDSEEAKTRLEEETLAAVDKIGNYHCHRRKNHRLLQSQKNGSQENSAPTVAQQPPPHQPTRSGPAEQSPKDRRRRGEGKDRQRRKKIHGWKKHRKP